MLVLWDSLTKEKYRISTALSFKCVCNYFMTGINYLHSHLVGGLLAVHRWNPKKQVS